jgi:hypothetical protein
MRSTHALHQLHHHIPRPHPHPHIHPTPRGIALTIPPYIRNHWGARYIRNRPHTQPHQPSPPCPPEPFTHAATSTRSQPPKPTMKMPHHYLHQHPPAKEHTLSPIPRLSTNPLPLSKKTHLKKLVNAKPPPHTPTLPQNIQHPLTQDPTCNPR